MTITLKKALTVAALSIATASFAPAAFAADITGAGATFPYPIYAKWAEAYKAKTGNGLNYQSIGSSGGIKQIKAKTVDFGATDNPVKFDDLQADGLVQFPAIIGGVVAIINVEGIKPGKSVWMAKLWQIFFKARFRTGMTSVLLISIQA